MPLIAREQQSPHALPRASATMSVHVEAIAVPCVIKKVATMPSL